MCKVARWKPGILIIILLVSLSAHSQLFGPNDNFIARQRENPWKGPVVRYEYLYKLVDGTIKDSILISQVSFDTHLNKIESAVYDEGEIKSLKTFTYSNNLLVKIIEEKYAPFQIKTISEIEYDSSGKPLLEKIQSLRTSNIIKYSYKFNDNNQLESIEQSDNDGGFFLIKRFEYENGKLIKSESYSQLGKDQSHIVYEWESDGNTVGIYQITNGVKSLLGKDFYEDGLLKDHTFSVERTVTDYMNKIAFSEGHLYTERSGYDNHRFLGQVEILEGHKLVGLRKFFFVQRL
jgi:hypothetical protein